MESQSEYFARTDTPAANSPVAKVMIALLAKNPGMSFDTARAEAKLLLDRAAGKKNYSLPRVLSAEQQAAEKLRLSKAFSQPLLFAA